MREKLIDIIIHTPCVAVSSRTAAGHIADNLIANGVTIPVRCKHCKSWNRFRDAYGELKTGQCFLHQTRTGEDDSCSEGERREGEL